MIRLTLCSLTLLSLLAGPASAALQCNNRLVTEGDHFEDVLDRCGPPDLQYDEGTRYITLESPTHPGVPDASLTQEVHVQVWIYDMGPNRLRQRLTFENGELARIESQPH